MNKEDKLCSLYERLIVDGARKLDATPNEAMSACGRAFMNVCSWICDAYGYSPEEKTSELLCICSALGQAVKKSFK